MVTTADAEIARMVRLLRNQGMEKRYANEVVGFNTRMTDIHAAIGRVQLGKLAGWTAQRQANAAFLTANLEGVVTPQRGRGRGARLPPVHDPGPRARPGRLRRSAGRASASDPASTTRLPSIALPVVRTHAGPARDAKAAREVLSLPVHPSLSQADLDTIVEAVNAVAKAGA